MLSNRALVFMLASSLVGCGSPPPSPTDGSVSEDGSPPGGPYFCGYFAEMRVVCDDPSFNRRSSLPGCEVVAPGTNCNDVVPEDIDWRPGPSSGCENYVNYGLSSAHGTSTEPLRGECAHWQRWFGGVIDCFNDATCPPGETCVADVCHCGSTPLTDEVRNEHICDGLEATVIVRSCSSDGAVIERREPVATCDPGRGESCMIHPEYRYAYCE